MTTTIEDDGLRAIREAMEPFAALGQYMIDQGFITKPDDAGLWGFDNHTLTYGDFRRIAAEYAALRSSSAVDGAGEPVARIANTDGPDRVYWLRPCPPKGTLLYASPTSDRASVVEEVAKMITDLADEWKRRGGLPSSEGEWPAYMAKAVRRLALSKEGEAS